MSYDLFFTKPEMTLRQFEAYFGNKNHYKIEKAQAWYENEDTGVYGPESPPTFGTRPDATRQ